MPDDPEGDEDKLLEDLVSDAIGSPAPARRDFSPPRERVVRITPLPILMVLLGGIALGAFFVYRNVASFLERPELPGEVAVAPPPNQTPGPSDLLLPSSEDNIESAYENRPDTPHPIPIPQAGEGGRRPGEGTARTRSESRGGLGPSAPKPVRMPAGDLSVQIGSYASQTYYQRALREIRRIGYEPLVTRKNSGGTSYELRIGPFPEREDAELVFRNLPEHGFKPTEMSLRTFRRKDESILYLITFEAVSDQGLLDRRVKKVRSLGLPSNIRKEEGAKQVRVVRVDHLTRPQAQRLVGKLKEKGYEPKILEE
ncbi:MAG: SPOR domain-containing protein [Nitrospirae bacterium]|nr:SPOR domain-containing protein [Nitrospirota bacterium]